MATGKASLLDEAKDSAAALTGSLASLVELLPVERRRGINSEPLSSLYEEFGDRLMVVEVDRGPLWERFQTLLSCFLFNIQEKAIPLQSDTYTATFDPSLVS